MNLLPVFSGKLKGIENAGSLAKGIEIISRNFKVPQVRERVSLTLPFMMGHEWESAEERNVALQHVEGMLAALDLGHEGQALVQFREAEDRLFFDYSNKAIRIAGDAGLNLKPLAKLQNEPGRSFSISGPKHQWSFRPLDGYDGLVPADILRKAHAVQGLGLRWHKSFIGEPHFPPAYEPRAFARVAVRDPILAISIGRWVLEVGRWE